MTNPGDPIEMIPTIQIHAVTDELRTMLLVIEAFGLGALTVSELLNQVDSLSVELVTQPPA